MSVIPIAEGDKTKQGNASCPKCGARVLISDGYFGDPPKCPNCNQLYQHDEHLKTFVK